MNIREKLLNEMNYLHNYANTAIIISTTAKHATDFNLLPRRFALNTGISSFIINDNEFLEETLCFFDGKVDIIFIDIEQKQRINLFKVAKEKVNKSKLLAVKPNDTTLESCDTLIRSYLNDDLVEKNILVIGTGNLASKIALRLSERQANVYIKGRSLEKENAIVVNLNFILPSYTSPVKTYASLNEDSKKIDVIVSFLSGQFEEEEILIPHIDESTFIIDGGINNFSSNFVEKMIAQKTTITRLDTRIALPYQFLLILDSTVSFFEDVFGESNIDNIPVVSGGYIGAEGTVIIDNIKRPNQIIGIADGSGGVKKDEQHTKSERDSIRQIQQAISTFN